MPCSWQCSCCGCREEERWLGSRTDHDVCHCFVFFGLKGGKLLWNQPEAIKATVRSEHRFLPVHTKALYFEFNHTREARTGGFKMNVTRKMGIPKHFHLLCFCKNKKVKWNKKILLFRIEEWKKDVTFVKLVSVQVHTIKVGEIIKWKQWRLLRQSLQGNGN